MKRKGNLRKGRGKRKKHVNPASFWWFSQSSYTSCTWKALSNTVTEKLLQSALVQSQTTSNVLLKDDNCSIATCESKKCFPLSPSVHKRIMKFCPLLKVGDLVRWQAVLANRPPFIGVVVETYRESGRLKWLRVVCPTGKESVRKPDWVEMLAKGASK